jgi:beta-lactamase regulating signal transducer with metallopeptidase domain
LFDSDLAEAPTIAETSKLISAAAITWLAGVGIAGFLAIRRWRAAGRTWLEDARAVDPELTRRARDLAGRIGLARVPRVCRSANARGPAAVGLRCPIIVLPESIARLPHSVVTEHVLLHELAHVARRDAWTALAWTVARVVFWVHPAVHWAAWHAETLREIACDARAARSSRVSSAYRKTLLLHARELVSDRRTAVAHFTPPRAQILFRLAALDRQVLASTRRGDVAAVLAFVALCTCVLPLARGSVAVAIPDFDQLDGCLRKRFAVMAALAAESSERSLP